MDLVFALLAFATGLFALVFDRATAKCNELLFDCSWRSLPAMEMADRLATMVTRAVRELAVVHTTVGGVHACARDGSAAWTVIRHSALPTHFSGNRCRVNQAQSEFSTENGQGQMIKLGLLVANAMQWP